MLRIKELNAGYDGMEILRKVNFHASEKEIVAIIGPNGAGKSTLLKSIFNLTSIYSGKIDFNGKNITKKASYKLIKEGISFVPQGRQVFGDLTVKENLEMGAFIIKDKAKVNKKLQEIFKMFPFLKERQDEYAFKLSGGQQQMLAIGRALMQDPKLLLLDEPSLGLAPKIMKEVFKTVQDINKKGVGIIVVEQNARQAVKIADRTYILENGEVALTGGKEILKDKKVQSIYLGGA
ncbi:MAG: ABC transporter ATP-binding protein [archaeon]